MYALNHGDQHQMRTQAEIWSLKVKSATLKGQRSQIQKIINISLNIHFRASQYINDIYESEYEDFKNIIYFSLWPSYKVKQEVRGHE